MKAIWNDIILAESNKTVIVEGNHYFPPETIKREYFNDSDYSTYCSWKGKASYYHIEAKGITNESAAWYYPDPKDKASHIKDHVAFWKDVKIVD